MRERLDEFAPNTTVALITFTDPANLVGYSETNEIGLRDGPFSILVDPERVAYRVYGLGRGSVARIYGLKAAKRYAEIFRSKGFGGLRRPTEDTMQLGGDFVIGPDGTLVYGFWGQGPADRPSVDDLIDAVSSAAP